MTLRILIKSLKAFSTILFGKCVSVLAHFEMREPRNIEREVVGRVFAVICVCVLCGCVCCVCVCFVFLCFCVCVFVFALSLFCV